MNNTKQTYAILGYLYMTAAQAQGNGGWFTASDREIVSELGGSYTTVHQAIDRLVGEGVIEKRRGDSAKSTMYKFTASVAPFCSTSTADIQGVAGDLAASKCSTLDSTNNSTFNVVAPFCSTQTNDMQEVTGVSDAPKCSTPFLSTLSEGISTKDINELKHKHTNVLKRNVKLTYSEGTYSACEGESVGGCECEIEDLEGYDDYTPNEALAEATDTGDCELCGLGFDLDLSCGCTYTDTDTNADTYTPTADDYTANATAQTTPTQTATYQPQADRARYWQSWNRFRVLVTNGEVTIAEGEKHLKTYISKLAQCYPHPADFATKHDQLLSQWRYVTDKANKANTNGTETGAQIPQDMAINIKTPYGSVADIIVYAQAARDNLVKAQANRERVDGIPSYIRYYFNAMRRMAKDADVDENRVRSIWDQCVCYSKSKSPDWTFSLDNLK